MRKFTLLLIGVSLLLIAVNLYAITSADLDTSRWIRLFSLGVFIMFFAKTVSLKNRLLISAIFLFLLLDIFFVKYELVFFSELYFLTGILGYLFLILYIRPELKKFKSTLFQKIMFGAVFSFDLILLLMLADMIPKNSGGPMFLFLFYVYGLTIILLKIVAVLFSNRKANQASFFFVCAVLGLVFSDVTLFIAYYLELKEFYYPSIIFYLLGLSSLVKFSSHDKEENGILVFEE